MVSRHRRVVDLAAGRVTVERHGEGGPDLGRSAVVAHYSSQPLVTRSVRALVAELGAAGHRVVVVSSSPFDVPLDWGDLDLSGVTVLRQPNVGYDFGSWAIALRAFPELAQDALIFANDSLAGPFRSLEGLLAKRDASPADVWGLTETMQFVRHAQSYFLAFRRGVLLERPLARFWSDVRHYGDKQLVIQRGELGLARLLASEGYSVDAAFVAPTVVAPGDNPTIAGWRTLLERGFPFVKRELIRNPGLVPDGATIGQVVADRFGTCLQEWLDEPVLTTGTSTTGGHS